MSNFYRTKSALECFYAELNLLKEYLEANHIVKSYGMFVELQQTDGSIPKVVMAFAGQDLPSIIGQLEILKGDVIEEYNDLTKLPKLIPDTTVQKKEPKKDNKLTKYQLDIFQKLKKDDDESLN